MGGAHASGQFRFFERAAYKQPVYHMPNENSTRELDDSGSQFVFLPYERQISTHRGACIN
jgi:hypothetical protein